jgi:hypothetical protein
MPIQLKSFPPFFGDAFAVFFCSATDLFGDAFAAFFSAANCSDKDFSE